jgi:hypothetical protein
MNKKLDKLGGLGANVGSKEWEEKKKMTNAAKNFGNKFRKGIKPDKNVFVGSKSVPSAHVKAKGQVTLQ